MPDPLTGKKTPPWWVRYRVLLYLGLGLLALDALVARFHRVWQAYSPDDYAERVENCRRQAPDLVVIGGSPVSEGVDPATLAGMRWRGHVVAHPYNLGLPGATTLEVWHAVEHGLASPPRLLIYGITASDLNDGRMEPHGPASLMDIGDLIRLARIRPKEGFWCLRHFGRARASRAWNLLNYRHGIQLWAADRLETLWPGLCPELVAEGRAGQNYNAAMHRSNGFAPQPDGQKRRLDQLKAGSSSGFYFHFLDNFRIGGHLAYLHLLLDWSAAHNVAVVLVDMPVSADLEDRLHSREYATYRRALAQLERERNVPVLRASRTSLGLTDADFADLVHMNARGTARFSAWLRAALEDKAYPQGPGKVYLHQGHVK
jgi:hypothetical protein